MMVATVIKRELTRWEKGPGTSGDTIDKRNGSADVRQEIDLQELEATGTMRTNA